MVSVLGLIFLPLIIILGISYVSVADMMGREVAQRSTLDSLVIILFIFPIAFVFYLLGNYGLVALQTLGSAIIIFLLLSWSFRKSKSGALLLDIGKNELWASSLMVGLLWLGLTISKTLSLFRHVSTEFSQNTNLVTELSDLFLYWSIAIFWILQALIKTEFRKNGIWILLRFITWQRIKSYKWESSHPNVLSIKYQPVFPFFSGWMSLTIPTQYREKVSHILNERLPDENL